MERVCDKAGIAEVIESRNMADPEANRARAVAMHSPLVIIGCGVLSWRRLACGRENHDSRYWSNRNNDDVTNMMLRDN